jgi:hypothetical protein
MRTNNSQLLVVCLIPQHPLFRLVWGPTFPQVPVYGVGGIDQLVPMPLGAARRRGSHPDP